MDIWSVLSQSPLALWLAYVHTTRPARTECALKHEQVDSARIDLGIKLTELHTDVREIREILIGHVSEQGGKR